MCVRVCVCVCVCVPKPKFLFTQMRQLRAIAQPTAPYNLNPYTLNLHPNLNPYALNLNPFSHRLGNIVLTRRVALILPNRNALNLYPNLNPYTQTYTQT